MEEILSQLEELKALVRNQNPYAGKEYLTAEEAGKFIGKNSQTIYKLTFHNAIPYSSPNHSKGNYFKKSDLIAWMEGNPNKSATQVAKEVARTTNSIKIR